MMLNRAIVLGVLLITSTAWAQRAAIKELKAQAGAAPAAPADADLAPRAPLAKSPAGELRMASWSSGRLIVKFADSAKARVNADSVVSMTAQDVNNAQRVIRQYGLQIAPAIRLKEGQLQSLQSRAASRSGKAQPDLAGMMYVTAPAGSAAAVLEAAARELNSLAEVEFVQFEPNFTTELGTGQGACCIPPLPNGGCIVTSQIGCQLNNPPGIYKGNGTSCDDPGICDALPTTGRCCVPGQGSTTCTDGLTAQQCAAQFGLYGGNGTNCAAIGGVCPILGACCLAAGCTTLQQAQCVGGATFFEGINCAVPALCDPITEVGRCCIPAGTNPPIVNCVDGVDEEFCLDQGGVYGGDGTSCIDINDQCPIIGACCVENECLPLAEDDCLDIPEAVYLGDGTNCSSDDACEDPDCGSDGTGSCLTCHDPNDPFAAGLFCDDEECCQDVCAIDPFCCEEDAASVPPGRGLQPHWDSICVYLAEITCNLPFNLSPCDTSFDPCNQQHAGTGCANRGCCIVVCNIEPFCCSTEWDAACVSLAASNCPANIPSSTTPQFTDAQGYLSDLPYDAPSPLPSRFGFIPANAGGGTFLDPCTDDSDNSAFLGYDGMGWNLQGLWQFGANLASQQGPGAINRTRGKGIKVGVIEHSAFADWQNPAFTHEDLRGKVIPESGQTIIINNSVDLTGNHGTACLGIIGAKDDGLKGHSLNAIGFASNGVTHVSDEIGTVGIAPDADLYFFPIVSLEEGGRLLTAIGKALTVFGPGDVLSFSIGPTDVCNTTNTTMVSSPGAWLMVRLASDLGVTCCVAAGNACCNIDPSAQFDGVDSGAIIVGAVTPGAPYCRLGFSNYCQTCGGANVVHASAWGEGVATLGYGDMFLGNDPANASGRLVRSYTNAFNGTSAATPQIAALAACMQGLAKQMFGIPLTPAQIRNIITNNGLPQCLTVDVDDIPGPIQTDPCLGDYDPDNDAARIGGAPNRAAYAITVGGTNNVAGGVAVTPMGDGSGLVDSICILRGDLKYGVTASIRAPDSNYLVVGSKYTTRGSFPSAALCAEYAPQIAAARYLGSGHVFDIMLKATNETAGASRIDVTTQIAYPGFTSIEIVEMYDWLANRWSVIGFGVLDGVTGIVQGTIDHRLPFATTGGGRFIQTGSGKMLLRVYVISFAPINGSDLSPDGGGGVNGRIDWIDIRTSAGGGFNPTGVGGGGTGGGGSTGTK